MPQSMLEDDLSGPYDAWKKAPGHGTNAAMLTALAPTIEGAIRTHVGAPNPLLTSQARIMAISGLQGYDPNRGRLKTHVYNQLLGLKRVNQQQTTILKVPERVALDKFHLSAAEDELRAQLGREATDDELADHTGFHSKRITKVRSYRPGFSEGALESGGSEVFGGVRQGGAAPDLSSWASVIYDELDPYHQKVMELSLGLNGRRPVPNHVIAQKLRRSPGAISQAKLRIQKMLDEEAELSPFGG